MKNKLLRRLLTASAAAIATAAIFTAAAHRLDLPKTNVAGTEYYYYDVRHGDNLYSIARTLSVTTDDIIRLNPAARDGVTPSMRLYFPVSEFVQIDDRTHTVAKNESLYGIAHSYGVSPDAILASNPAARDGLCTGMVLIIPANDKPQNTAQTQTVSTAQPAGVEMAGTATVSDETGPAAGEEPTDIEEPVADEPARRSADALLRSERAINERRIAVPADSITPAEGDTLSLVIMQPFMLDDANAPRQAEYVTDFYRGFLLAADSLSRHGSHVRVSVYDTCGSTGRVDSLMSSPGIHSADLIIMPDNEEQMAAIASKASENTLLFNTFNVKSTLQDTNANVIQANIPHDPMYDKAISAFERMFEDCTPVFISRNGGAADKEEFTTALRDHLVSQGRIVLDIMYDNSLNADNLLSLVETSKYVIVPASGRRDEFNKFAPALRDYRAKLDDPSRLRLFGYPDWVVFRGSNLEMLGNLDAVIYSRFYADPSDPATIDLSRKFMRAYGREWIDTAPVQALVGFDTGMYLIEMMRGNDGDITAPELYSRGIQQDFGLTDRDIEGYYNESLFFINFKPSGAVVKTRL